MDRFKKGAGLARLGGTHHDHHPGAGERLSQAVIDPVGRACHISVAVALIARSTERRTRRAQQVRVQLTDGRKLADTEDPNQLR